MKKRVLSLLMAIAICLSMLPSAALAEIPGTGTNEVQTEQQITEEQKPEEQIPDEQKPDEQKPDEQNPDEQNPDEQKPDEQNPDEQKPAKAPRKAPAAETHTGDHGECPLPEGATWQGVSSLPSDSGYYYLTGFVTIDSTWKPADGTVLCLNGYSISMTNNGPVIEVQPDVTFTLCDCGDGGKITHTDGKTGRGVFVGSNATFNMYGGSITGNTADNNHQYGNGGVYVEGGTFNMSGGSITKNTVTGYGGVYVSGNGTFTMNGGVISDNTSTNGGGVFVSFLGQFAMNDGEISGNTAANYGGGVSVAGGGSFTMYGGSITENKAGSGGGVYFEGTFTIYGGSITKNTVTGYGGGVYVCKNGTFTVSGNVNIMGNKKSDETVSNVYLLDKKTITIGEDGLDSSAKIGVTTAKEPTAGKLVWFATGANNPDLNYGTIFSCDNGSQYVVGKVETGKLFFGLHQHSWEYELSTDGKAITATCTEGGCPLENRIGGSVKISAFNTDYDGSPKAAKVTASGWQGDAVDSITVTYTGRKETNYNSTNAPTNAGDYTARITLGDVTASVEYSITAKEVTVTGITATDRYYAKDNLEVTLTGGTVTGVISGDTVTIDLINAKGTMTDANAGTGKAVTVTGVALGGADKGNYKLKEQPTGVTVNITKATAPTLKNITVSQKYTVTTGEKAIGTVMPADAGTLTYAPGIASKTGSVTIDSWAVDTTGKVTYTLSGGKAGDTVTLPVTITSDNYADATVKVVITFAAKDIPNVTAKDIVVTYDGNPIPADKITGTADVAGTWEWKADTAVTDVSDSGTKTVVFKPADSVNYAEVEKTITVTINRATPTGTPTYTAITTGGKTLADAGLTTADSNLSVPGTVKWVDDTGNVLDINTKVEANKEYKWLFTPTNTNYTTLTGTIVLYPASTGIVIYTPVNDAIFLSGANQIVAPGSAATFRINKNFGEFRSVAVDGVTLDKSNYRAWSGSTYVKLTPAYMKTLSAGTHTLAVYFTGATATTTFTISAGSSNPATGAGDFAGVGAAVAMAAASLLGAAAVLRRK